MYVLIVYAIFVCARNFFGIACCSLRFIQIVSNTICAHLISVYYNSFYILFLKQRQLIVTAF